MIWNSTQDLPGVDLTTVRFRITPRDVQVGVSDETGDFHVDNNVPPSVKLAEVSGAQTAEVLLVCTIEDAEGDSVRLEVMYSLDEGGTWTQATLEGEPVGSLGTKTLTWKAREDLGVLMGEAWVRVVPWDLDAGGRRHSARLPPDASWRCYVRRLGGR